MIGTLTPASASRAAISGTAAAASSLFTVTRTSCEPEAASAAICAAVPAASAVSVFVMDCTTTGCADPTGTPPTCAGPVRLGGPNVALRSLYRRGDPGNLSEDGRLARRDTEL